MNVFRITRALGFTSLLVVVIAATALMATSASAAGTGTFTVQPSATTLTPGGTLTVTLQLTNDTTITGAQTDLNFDETRLAATGVSLGPAWAGSQFLIGIGGQTPAQAIASANGTGVLENVAGYFPPASGSVAAGTAVFATVTFNVLANGGDHDLTVTQREGIDVNGDPVNPVNGTNATVANTGPITVGGVVETLTGSNASGSGLATWVIALGAFAAAVVVGGLGFGARFVTRKAD